MYILMEYVEGSSLEKLLEKGPLPPTEALSIAMDVCDALEYAHTEGIIHRDIKPANILIDNRGYVKLTDFGLAKLLEGTPVFLTGGNEVLGTFPYMAPEQFDPAHVPDHRADIYAAGIVLYEMLAGEPPVGNFRKPSERTPVGGQLDEIILTALSDRPSHRFQSAAEMRRRLAEVQSNQLARTAADPKSRERLKQANPVFMLACLIWSYALFTRMLPVFFGAEIETSGWLRLASAAAFVFLATTGVWWALRFHRAYPDLLHGKPLKILLFSISGLAAFWILLLSVYHDSPAFLKILTAGMGLGPLILMAILLITAKRCTREPLLPNVSRRTLFLLGLLALGLGSYLSGHRWHYGLASQTTGAAVYLFGIRAWKSHPDVHFRRRTFFRLALLLSWLIALSAFLSDDIHPDIQFLTLLPAVGLPVWLALQRSWAGMFSENLDSRFLFRPDVLLGWILIFVFLQLMGAIVGLPWLDSGVDERIQSSLNGVSFQSSAGDVFAFADSRGTVEVHLGPPEPIRAIRTIRMIRVQERISALAVSTNGEVLATGNREVKLWSTSQGSLLAGLIPETEAFVRSIIFDRSDRLLAAGMTNGQVEVWDLASLTRRFPPAAPYPITHLRFSSEGSLVAGSSSSNTFFVAGNWWRPAE